MAVKTKVSAGKRSFGVFCPIFEGSVEPKIVPEVDRENGIIKNLCVLGPESRMSNGKLRRVYTKECISESVSMYEGVMVNIDHPLNHDVTADRSFGDRLGKLTNVRVVEGKIYGDLVFNRVHPLAGMVCEAAENHKLRDTCGFSHVADLESTWKDGIETVHHIHNVRWVDLVADPATTRSLCESRTSVMTKDKEVCEEAVDNPEIQNTTVETPPEVGSVGSDPIDAVVAALLAEYKSGKMDMPTFKKKIGKALDLFSDDNSSSGGGDSDSKSSDSKSSDSKDSKDPPSKESKCSVDDAMTILESAGVSVTRIRIKALCAFESSTDREAFVDSLKEQGQLNIRPKSGEKPISQPKSVVESQTHSVYGDLKKVREGMFKR